MVLYKKNSKKIYNLALKLINTYLQYMKKKKILIHLTIGAKIFSSQVLYKNITKYTLKINISLLIDHILYLSWFIYQIYYQCKKYLLVHTCIRKKRPNHAVFPCYHDKKYTTHTHAPCKGKTTLPTYRPLTHPSFPQLDQSLPSHHTPHIPLHPP